MIKKIGEVYKCSICGNIVEVNHVGGGELVCCGKPMDLLIENTEDIGQEKHIPIVSKIDNNIKIKVGEIEHPMTVDHHIEWIELITGDQHYKRFLSPSDKPEITIKMNISGEVIIREYCNLHGLWKTTMKL